MTKQANRSLFQIVQAIKARRESLRVTQQTLSESSGVAIAALKRFEAGRGNPTLSTLQKLCDTLGLEIKLTAKGTVNDEAGEDHI